MDAEYYLRSYATFNVYLIQAETALDKIKLNREKVYSKGTLPPDGQPGNPEPSNPTAEIVEQLEKYDMEIDRINAEIDTYKCKMREIENAVSRLSDEEQQVAKLRYMRGKQLQWHEIAAELHYNERQCRRIDKRLKIKVEKMSVNGHKYVI